MTYCTSKYFGLARRILFSIGRFLNVESWVYSAALNMTVDIFNLFMQEFFLMDLFVIGNIFWFFNFTSVQKLKP